MNYFLEISLGLYLGLILKTIDKGNRIKKTGTIILTMLIVILLPIYAGFNGAEETIDIKTLVIAYLLCVTGVILSEAALKYRAAAVKTLEKLDRPFIFNEASAMDDEEDYMKTRYGKIMTAVCILLVIYMFASAFCMYRLNQKINSVYEITQEMQNK